MVDGGGYVRTNFFGHLILGLYKFDRRILLSWVGRGSGNECREFIPNGLRRVGFTLLGFGTAITIFETENRSELLAYVCRSMRFVLLSLSVL